MDAATVLDRSFLEMRHRVLDLAAALDRLDRAARVEAVRADRRLVQLRQSLRLLLDDEPDRAERVQMVFSLPYDPAWRRA